MLIRITCRQFSNFLGKSANSKFPDKLVWDVCKYSFEKLKPKDNYSILENINAFQTESFYDMAYIFDLQDIRLVLKQMAKGGLLNISVLTDVKHQKFELNIRQVLH